MLYLCLTADYEPFLGENYNSIEDIIINPTNKICSILDEYDIKITFFIDVLFLDYLKRKGYEKERNIIIQNIVSLFHFGHSIQLHIHPHWLKANGDLLKYTFDSKYYKLSDFFGESEFGGITGIIHDSINILKNDVFKFASNYKPVAYRAGGWSIQPEKTIIDALVSEGIFIDSSVLKNCYSGKGKIEHYDFRNSPNDFFWRIKSDSGVNTASLDKFDNFFEIPVYTYWSFSLILHNFKRIILNRLFKKRNLAQRKGRSCLSKKSFRDNVRKTFFEPLKFSLDNTYDIPIYLKIIKKLSIQKNDSVMCMYFHPKLLSDHDLEKIKLFFDELKKHNVSIVTLDRIVELFG